MPEHKKEKGKKGNAPGKAHADHAKAGPHPAHAKKTVGLAHKTAKKEKEAQEKKTREPKKKIPFVKKNRAKKSKEVKELSGKALGKGRPQFRGRFGNRGIRRVSLEKWQKWRVPRGMDIQQRNEHGRVPNPGYGTRKEIRFLHPSGYREEPVRNAADVERMAERKEKTAVRISAGVGQRKRREIIEKANSLGVWVLN